MGIRKVLKNSLATVSLGLIGSSVCSTNVTTSAANNKNSVVSNSNKNTNNKTTNSKTTAQNKKGKKVPFRRAKRTTTRKVSVGKKGQLSNKKKTTRVTRRVRPRKATVLRKNLKRTKLSLKRRTPIKNTKKIATRNTKINIKKTAPAQKKVINTKQKKITPLKNTKKIVTRNTKVNKKTNNKKTAPAQKKVTNTKSNAESKNVQPNGICGLTNIGNSCYFNAALQQLYANTELKDAIVSGNWSNKQPTLSNLKNLFSEMDKGQTVSGDFMQKFNKGLGNVHTGSQEDSSGCYMSLINKCTEEGLKFNNFNVETKANIYDATGKKALSDERVQPNNDSVNLMVDEIIKKGYKSIADYLKNGIVFCDDISNYLYKGNKIPAKNIEKITSYPNKLVISLGRTGRMDGSFNQYKSVSKLQIDEKITINGNKYNLKAVTAHWGSDLNSGHYINYVCDKNGKWFKVSDSSVTPCTYAEAADDIKTNGIMATYEKN